MMYVYHITLERHLMGRYTGLVSMTKAIHTCILNKGHTHMIQISPLKVNNSSTMVKNLEFSLLCLFHDPAVVMRENLCEENWVVIKIFVNIKQFDTIHATVAQVVALLACQPDSFL